MRLVLSCALLIAASGTTRKAAAIDYCPLQLQGQYGNSYYYYCQTKQDTNCTYTYIMVDQAYQCGGCCDGCCEEMCISQFTKLIDETKTKKADSRSAPAKFEDTEVVPIRIPTNPQYVLLTDQFCTPGRNYTVEEVWLTVDATGGPFYFRCFDVTDKNRPREKLRVGHQFQNSPPAGTTSLMTHYDASWIHKTSKVHRVIISDNTNAMGDDRPFYLLSVKDIVVNP